MRSRRSLFLLLGALGLCTAPILLGCKKSNETATIVWHAYRDDERAALTKVVDQWNSGPKPATDPPVRLVALPSEAMSDKLAAAIPNGDGPDLFLFAHDKIGDFAERGLIAPVAYWMDDEFAAIFVPESLSALGYRGRLYGLPLAMKCIALYFNKAIVQAPPATFEELEVFAKKWQASGNGQVGLGWPLVTQLYFHAPILHAFGASVITEGTINIDTPAHQAAAAFAKRISGAGGIIPADPTPPVIATLFNRAKTPFVISGPWFASDIDKSIDYGVAPLPLLSETGRKMAPFLGVEAVLLSARARNADAAMRFARFLADIQSARLRAKIGHQITPLVEMQSDQSDPLIAAFARAATSARAMPSDPRMAAIWSPYDRALEETLVLGESPAAAMKKAQAEIARKTNVTNSRGPDR